MQDYAPDFLVGDWTEESKDYLTISLRTDWVFVLLDKSVPKTKVVVGRYWYDDERGLRLRPLATGLYKEYTYDKEVSGAIRRLFDI